MSKNYVIIQQQYERLLEREKQLRQELARQKKAMETRERKERSRKMFILADMVIEHCGEGILEKPEALERFLSLYEGTLEAMLKD